LGKDERGRKLLQDVGKIGRDYDENIWCRKLFQYLEYKYVIPLDVIIIDDWRFINELNYIKDLEGYSAYTVRIYAPNREILKNTKAYNDISEISLSDDPLVYDYWINNEKEGLDHLRFLAEKMCDSILEKEFKGD